ncbi:MAG: RtcB family protein [Clostridia bacterium]|nr:RtcB family protein [Clostridia bacterium]
MIIQGQFNTAKIFTEVIEAGAIAQIQALCDFPVFKESKIRVMPDVHAGAGCTIGTTMTIKKHVVPNMVGVDIGCGMELVQLEQKELDLQNLDKFIRANIPSGMTRRKTPHNFAEQTDIENLRCFAHINATLARKSIATLGGGNHFIEVDIDEDGNKYLVVHSGSRHIGLEVAEYYQKEAYRALCGNSENQIKAVIAKLKSQGKNNKIQAAIENLKAKQCDIPMSMAYVSGQLFDDYIHDMKIIQGFATLNRKAMVDVIMKGLNLSAKDSFTTIHNYIDTDEMILRKGAVSAKKGERLLIPINMRDGSLICTGKGNKDWNCSAPHGAGRLMSRSKAFKTLTMEEFQREMIGIYSTSINRSTLDESPMAYKKLEDIVDNITPTVNIEKRITPIYNFKASENFSRKKSK